MLTHNHYSTFTIVSFISTDQPLRLVALPTTSSQRASVSVFPTPYSQRPNRSASQPSLATHRASGSVSQPRRCSGKGTSRFTGVDPPF